MIAAVLSYRVPPAEIDVQRPAHLDWLRAALAEGRLLLSGRDVDVTGGLLLMRGTRAEVAAWLATDPFAIHGLADYRVLDIRPSMIAPGLEALDG